MNFPGMPGGGGGASGAGGAASMSDQEAAMVKAVRFYLYLKRRPSGLNDFQMTDANSDGELSGENCTFWRHGVRSGGNVWAVHVERMCAALNLTGYLLTEKLFNR